MSATGEKWADDVMASIRARIGVSKAAGALAPELPLTEAVVRQLCREFGGFVDMVGEHTEHVTTVLEAIAKPLPEEQYLAALRPDQWRVGLVPNLPGQEHPVRGNDERFS